TVAVGIGKSQYRETGEADITRILDAIGIQVVELDAALGRLLEVAEIIVRRGLTGGDGDDELARWNGRRLNPAGLGDLTDGVGAGLDEKGVGAVRVRDLRRFADI